MQNFRETDSSLVGRIAALQDKSGFKELHWEGSFEEYLKIVRENPRVTRTAFQRIYDMILSHGKTEYIDNKKRLIRYHFFHDEPNGGRDAVYGLDVPLMKLVNVFKSAAQGYGTEKRVILLHGPVGSSKSTIVRLLKKGLEEYSRTPDGALYTFFWALDRKGDGAKGQEVYHTPMNEDPLLLIPEDWREKVYADICPPDSGFQIPARGDLCPASRLIFKDLMSEYKGDFSKVMQHVRVKRLLLSEKDRIGVGTFQPKDEKNQDSTELTVDVNYRKIAEYGSDSDPRAFNFDGEFNIANRGIIEFVEVLKLDVAFLYDLLGASQEHRIKPKKFPQTDIYEKDYNSHKIRGKHIAPHTLEMAAMWAVLTRLEEPKKHNLTLLQKLKLYNGKTLPGFTEDNIKELRKEANREGMEGISPRYVQDKISNALVSDKGEGCVNPFMVLNELEGGLRHNSLISSEEVRKRDRELLSVVKGEYEDIVKNEVQRAISADEDAIAKLCGNYIDNIKAYTQREKVRKKYTGQYEEPDERLMRAIEEKIDIPESRKDDFRREIMNYIGALAIEGKTFNYRTNERLHKALELKLFEDQKDSIKLKNLVSSVVDKDTQEKIDIVKDRMIKSYGYCEICSTDVR